MPKSGHRRVLTVQGGNCSAPWIVHQGNNGSRGLGLLILRSQRPLKELPEPFRHACLMAFICHQKAQQTKHRSNRFKGLRISSAGVLSCPTFSGQQQVASPASLRNQLVIALSLLLFGLGERNKAAFRRGPRTSSPEPPGPGHLT